MLKKVQVLAAFFLLLQGFACTDKTEYVSKVEQRGPVAEARAEPHFGEAPLKVAFNASGSYVPGGGELTYSWDFDDGKISEGVSAKHTFRKFGTYMVVLTVTDSEGRKGTDTVVIIVH
jgi:PKD repeat protein